MAARAAIRSQGPAHGKPWNEFHADPRTSYYLFLRQSYALSARAAHEEVRQFDNMVMALQDRPSAVNALVSRVRGAIAEPFDRLIHARNRVDSAYS